jgi:hypothetical protein
MKKITTGLRSRRPGRSAALVFALCAVLVVLGAFRPEAARADAGPVPTRTPTATRTPEPEDTAEPSLTPTQSPTATFTVIPSPTPILEVEEVVPPAVVATPTPVPGGGSLFACWPIALIVILAVIIGATYLLTRKAIPGEEIA